jgi:hypothetical protein
MRRSFSVYCNVIAAVSQAIRANAPSTLESLLRSTQLADAVIAPIDYSKAAVMATANDDNLFEEWFDGLFAHNI